MHFRKHLSRLYGYGRVFSGHKLPEILHFVVRNGQRRKRDDGPDLPLRPDHLPAVGDPRAAELPQRDRHQQQRLCAVRAVHGHHRLGQRERNSLLDRAQQLGLLVGREGLLPAAARREPAGRGVCLQLRDAVARRAARGSLIANKVAIKVVCSVANTVVFTVANSIAITATITLTITIAVTIAVTIAATITIAIANSIAATIAANPSFALPLAALRSVRVSCELDRAPARGALAAALDVPERLGAARAVRHPLAARRGPLHARAHAELPAVLQRLLGAGRRRRAQRPPAAPVARRLADDRALRAGGGQLRRGLLRGRRPRRGLPLRVPLCGPRRVLPGVRGPGEGLRWPRALHGLPAIRRVRRGLRLSESERLGVRRGAGRRADEGGAVRARTHHLLYGRHRAVSQV